MEQSITANGGTYIGALSVSGDQITETVTFNGTEIWRSTWSASMQPEGNRAAYLSSMTTCAAQAHADGSLAASIG